ncbi:WD40 repeat domain-containing serine/threonine protein kinase [Streptosporangium sp. NPDC000396]|uniref:WD40 repeat domain-containing serine/threonine protein kinase n=1 Tax=Streptosporangium sp. NPDC000396 TaxID=3366185 RepID=UPI00367CB938
MKGPIAMAFLVPGDPAQLGDYWLAGRLGEGGQGVVYEAYDAAGHRVALKVLKAGFAGNSDVRAGFVKEVVAARRVAQFCTARVIDADLGGPRPYIVSEFVEGPSLRQAVEEKGVYRSDRLHRLATGMATALTAIHAAGVVHRDLKPDNVLITPDGPRVIDFGIARTDDMTATTEGRSGPGTPSYMAPERLGGQRGGPPADVWAWGAVVLFAATGRAPFAADNITVLRYRVLTGRPDFSALEEPLRGLVEASMAREAGDRPDARALLLRLVGGGDETARLLAEGSRTAEAVREPAAGAPHLGELAERAYTRLSSGDQAAVPPILLRMVLAGEDAEGVLRKAHARDLFDGAIATPTVERVLHGFGQEGLLVRQGDTLTLASAALLRAWPRMRQWIETDREGFHIHDLLCEAARLWDGNGRRPDDLYRGTALNTAARWAETGRHHLSLNLLERAFLEASAAHGRAHARRRRQITGTVAALLATALVAAGIAVVENAFGARQRDIAAARQAAERAEALRSSDPETARLLSLAAWRLAPVTEARAALYSSLAQREREVFPVQSATGEAKYDLSRDGRTLAVVDRGRLTLWDVSTRRRSLTVDGVTGRVRAVALSPDGRRLAVGGDTSVRVWDVRRGMRISQFGQGAGRLSFSPGGRLLAGVTAGGHGEVWDLTSETRVLDLPGVRDVKVSPDESLAAVSFHDGRYELRDWRRLLLTDRGEVVSFSPDSRATAVSRDGGIRLRDVATSRWNDDAIEKVRPRSAVFSQDGGYLAAYDGTAVGLWSATGTRLLRHPAGDLVTGLRFGPGARTLSYLLANGSVVVLDIADLTRPPEAAGGVRAAVFAPGAGVAVLQRREIELWDVSNRRTLARLSTSRSSPVAMAFSPDGRTLALGTARPARVTLWDVPAGRGAPAGASTGGVPAVRRGRTLTVEGATEAAGLAFSPDGGTLAVAPFSDTVTPPAKNWKKIQLWDVGGGARTRLLSQPGAAVMVFRPDGEALATGGDDSAVVGLRSGAVPVRSFGTSVDGVRALAFSPDGRTVATGSLTSGVDLWDAGSHRRLGHLVPARGDPGEVNVLAFSPDGRTLAAAGGGTLQLWDVAGRTPLGLPFSQQAGDILALAFTADGRTLHSVSTDGGVRGYPVDPGSAAAAVCARSTASLSEGDWERLIPGSPYREVC